MPEMRFSLRWPDGSESLCYSPSLVITEHFEVGASYPMEDFLARSREALTIASERVRLRYGFACSRALGQLDAIERQGRAFPSTAPVTVLAFFQDAS